MRWAGAIALILMARTADAAPAHFANADDAALVARGRLVYMQTCASCHGRNLQGQPLWQLLDGVARAPAHDASGHTWQHSDEDLFHITATGRFMSSQGASHMPAFAAQLSPRDILAALAFIKSRWPIGLRVTQAMLNPNLQGMPAGADKADWTLPPNCKATVR